MARDPDLEQQVAALVAPVVDECGAELVEVEVKGQTGSRMVRVYADADGGLDLDDIASISSRVGDVIDAADAVTGKWTLEVSSPGVDRPLVTPTQLRRNLDRDLRVVRTREAIDRGEKGEVVGRLAAIDDESLLLHVGKQAAELTIPLTDVDHARVVLPF